MSSTRSSNGTIGAVLGEVLGAVAVLGVILGAVAVLRVILGAIVKGLT